ncbi:MAG TPA: Ldh family oxidoreductase, partial [Chloroflexota bacterium]|nr:Ldh family oxidoreductase [Chloroflexota bacterium]
VPVEDAELVANSLVLADLWGHQSHGMMRLPWYYRRIRSGVMKPVTRPDMVIDSGGVAVLDGNDGVGQVLASRAMHEAIGRAKTYGLGAVGVRNSNHFGTAGYFTRMAPVEGCVGLLTTNAGPAMAPWGGRVKAVGNNPWSIAAPGGRRGLVVMDVANTVVARGKILLARQQGALIPEGWALNVAGEPTTDPNEALNGLILPMAGHKGYIISLMIDVLSGVLTGSSFGSSVSSPYYYDRRSGSGHLAIALDIGTFMPLATFNSRMDLLLDEIKAAPLAVGFDDVSYPGEPEARNEELNRANGLKLPEQTLRDLDKIAAEVGVDASFA